MYIDRIKRGKDTGKLLSIVKIAVMIEILLQIGTKLNQAF